MQRIKLEIPTGEYSSFSLSFLPCIEATQLLRPHTIMVSTLPRNSNSAQFGCFGGCNKLLATTCCSLCVGNGQTSLVSQWNKRSDSHDVEIQRQHLVSSTRKKWNFYLTFRAWWSDKIRRARHIPTFTIDWWPSGTNKQQQAESPLPVDSGTSMQMLTESKSVCLYSDRLKAWLR